MPATSQSQAIAVGNNLIALAQSLYQLESAITQTTTQYTQLTMGTTFSAMATTAVNADGSLGTADATPSATAGHVIDTRLTNQAALSRAISASDLATLVTLLQAVSTLLAGSAPSQQGEAPQLLAKVSGG